MASRAPALDWSLDSVLNSESVYNGITFSGNHLRLAGDIAKAIGRRLPETLEMRCEKEEQHEMEERRFYMDMARD